MVLELALHKAFILVVLLSALPLLASSLMGLMFSVLQSATQIQDQAITYVVKVSTVGLLLYHGGPFAGRQFQDFLREMMNLIAILGQS